MTSDGCRPRPTRRPAGQGNSTRCFPNYSSWRAKTATGGPGAPQGLETERLVGERS